MLVRRQGEAAARARRGSASGQRGVEFQINASLRLTWLSAQRLDRELMSVLDKRPLPAGYRFGANGLLAPPIGATHVPVVPTGNATANLSWRRWVFLQCHVGRLGAHRNGQKTESIIRRQC